jgi:cytochrome c biogenesis protein CcdA
MVRVSLVAVLATLGLTIPFLVLGILGAAWLTQNLTWWATAIASATQVDWGELALEGWSRWPEALGMVVGQALILLIVVLARDRAVVPRRAP